MIPPCAIVFAHYSPRGHVSASLRGLVREASRLSPYVYFVSTRVFLEPDDELYGQAKVISRENFGYDFWSYRVGLLEALRHDVHRVILVNSSFVALDPQGLFAEFCGPLQGPRVRGLTVSHETTRHAQSYFLCFEDREFLRSPDFLAWWQGMTPISDREQVIQKYEIGLSRYFAGLGVPIEAAYEPGPRDLLVGLSRAIGSRQLSVGHLTGDKVMLDLNLAKSLNPAHFLWDCLFQHFSVLKLELLKSNPTEQSLDRLIRLLQSNPALMAMVQDAIDGTVDVQPDQFAAA